VPGLAAGQACETALTQTSFTGYYPMLEGVLLKDNFGDFNFVSNLLGAFVRFKVIPGDAGR
jgi:hypothetical protein